MFRPAFRVLSASPLPRAVPRVHVTRRLISTAPPHQKSRSWRSSAARWAVAGALVYYYNAATVFAEEPACQSTSTTPSSTLHADVGKDAVHAPPETSRETEAYPTVASVSEQRKAHAQSQSLASSPPSQTRSATVEAAPDTETAAPGSPGELEEEASQQGAFNEETGEINWDCPCLGGMAHGPCGEQFRAAFSCFVFSKEEPKGVDCIEHFKTMQNCFRDHPDVYGAELEDDEMPPEAEQGIEGDPVPAAGEPATTPQPARAQSPSSRDERALEINSRQDQDPEKVAVRDRVQSATEQVTRDHDVLSETNEAVPKAWHDGRTATQSN